MIKRKTIDNRISINLTPSLSVLLTVLFIGLKLTGYIAWSWWWVLSLIWIPIVLLVAFLVAMFVFALFVGN